jgi:hypothetical protein
VMVIMSTAADESPRLQSLAMVLCSAYIAYLIFTTVRKHSGQAVNQPWAILRAALVFTPTQAGECMLATWQHLSTPLTPSCATPPHVAVGRCGSQAPFYSDLVTMSWVGLWTGIIYTCVLLVR